MTIKSKIKSVLTRKQKPKAKPKEKDKVMENIKEETPEVKEEIKSEPFNIGKWAISCLGCGRTDEEVAEIALRVLSYLEAKQMESNWDNCFIAYQAIINGMG